MSHKKGHTHLQQIVNALETLGDQVKCEKIILSHFSMKYPEKYIRESIAKAIPDKFKDKVAVLI